MESFKTQPGFCPACGSILPHLSVQGNVICYNCKKEYGPSTFGAQETKFTIHFNTYDPEKFESAVKQESDEEDINDGPTIERKCPKCAHNKMSYATLQLRSADEGQTVFFTCLKCKYKESENS